MAATHADEIPHPGPHEGFDEEAAVSLIASLLDVYRMRTVVAGRIDLQAPWRVAGDPQSDLLLLIIQVYGTSALEIVGTSGPLVLTRGDVVLIPRAGYSYLHDGSHPPQVTHKLRLRPRRSRSVPRPLRLASGQIHSSFLCCLLELGDESRSPLLSMLPEVLHIQTASTDAPNEAHRQALEGVRRSASMMIAESAEPGPGAVALMSRLAEVLLVQVLRLNPGALHAAGGSPAWSDPIIGPAIRLAHRDPAEPLTVADLAAACGLSRSAFSARFTERVGVSPGNYLTDWKLAVARQRLINTELPIARIARDVGYRSEASFRRAFRDLYGRSPSDVRSPRRRALRDHGDDATTVADIGTNNE